MVAHGEEAAAGQPVQHGEGLVPVAVVATVVHQVAGLDGQVIVRQIQPVQDAGQRRVLALLQVAEDQRLHVGVDIARGEAADLRPALPVAHLIVVGRAGFQVLRLGAADVGRRAVRESQQAAGAVIDLPLRQGVLALRQAQLGALGRLGGVCQPAHVQAVGTVGGIAPDMGGRSVRLAPGQVDGSRQGGGNAALAVSGRHRQGRLLPVDRDEHLALRVRGPQRRLALVEPHAQGRLAGGRMGDEEVAGLREIHHHSAGAHGVGRGDGQGDGVAEACLPGKTADDAGEVGAGHGAGGHLHSQGSHGAAVHRTVDGKAQNLRCAVIVRFDGLSLGVRQDVALGKGRRQLHIRRHRGDRVIPGSEIQGHGPAQHRAGLVGRHLNGGALALGVIHRNLIALNRLIAIAVHHRYLNGVATVGQLQAGPQLRGAGDAVHLPAVHIEGGVVHTRVVAVVRHAVAVGSLDVDGAAFKAHARLQFLLLIHDHGLDDRVGLVLRGAAVNEGQVIEIEVTLQGKLFCGYLGRRIKRCKVFGDRDLPNGNSISRSTQFRSFRDILAYVDRVVVITTGKLSQSGIIPLCQNDISILIRLAFDPALRRCPLQALTLTLFWIRHHDPHTHACGNGDRRLQTAYVSLKIVPAIICVSRDIIRLPNIALGKTYLRSVSRSVLITQPQPQIRRILRNVYPYA